MMLLYKVEVGSAMYNEGIRWTESLQSFGLTDIRTQSMVLDFILTISMINDHDHPVTLVMLVVIIISQVLGHMNFNKISQLENNMNLFTLNDVAINHLLSHQSHVKSFPDMKISRLHL